MMSGQQRRTQASPQDYDTLDPALAALAHACSAIVQAGKAAPEAVAGVTTALLDTGNPPDSPVTAAEARLLIDTNDAIAFARNASDWRTLYACAIGNYLAARSGITGLNLARTSWIGATDELPAAAAEGAEASSAAWLIRQVARTQNINPADQALLVLLDQRLPGLARGLVATAG